MVETAAATGTMKNDGDENDKRNEYMKSSNNSNNMEINPLPPDLTDATIDDANKNHTEYAKPPGDYTNHEEEMLEDGHYYYSTTNRIRHRLSLWKEYMANTQETKDFPDPKQYLFSSNPTGDKESVEQLIWGDEDSLKSLYMRLEDLQAQSVDLKKDNILDSLKSHQEDLKEMQDKLQKLNNDAKAELSLHEATRIGIEEAIASNPNESSELLADLELVRGDHEKLRVMRQANINFWESWIKEKQDHIQWLESFHKSTECIKDIPSPIIECQRHIRFREDLIEVTLKSMVESYGNKRELLYILSDVRDKGNATIESDTSSASDNSTASLDGNRFDKSGRYDPSPSTFEKILNGQPDRNYLNELLQTKEIIGKKEHLLELQVFVAAIMEKAQMARTRTDKKIKAFVDVILEWKPGTTIESLGQLKGRFACPPAQECQTVADQPILCALIFRILSILGQGSGSVNSEQVVAPIGTQGNGRRMDSIHDEYREFLHVTIPEMLGPSIEVRPAPKDYRKVFQKNQRVGREQIIARMAKRLQHAFNFGGIGEDDVVSGVVLSTFSIQVLEMQLTRMGTGEGDIVFRETAHVPLLGGRLVPTKMKHAVAWDMGSDGVLLLASAVLDLTRKTLFCSERDQTIHDISAKQYCSSRNQEPEQHTGIAIQSLLGNGGSSHVFDLGEGRFMKIPRIMGLVHYMMQECEVLKKLNQEPHDKPWFPKIMPWGVSTVKLSIRSEISQRKVLRLEGIVGCSLGNYFKYTNSEMQDDDVDLVHGAIQEVYDALEYAHSKGIFHMDVQPDNIIVKWKRDRLDVLLTDWSCGMLEHEKIEQHNFAGCISFAHDDLLGNREEVELMPKADFDFASLGFTWYHVMKGRLDWLFERAKYVTDQQLQDRRELMEQFVNDDTKDFTVCSVPKVRKIFVRHESQSGNECKKRTREGATC